MNITSRSDKGVEIIKLDGKLTIGVGDVQLRNAVQQGLDQGKNKILLNMQGLTTIDSSGVGELVSAYTRASNRGAKLKLCNLPPKIQDILTITQLITVFDVYDTEAEALTSFN